MQPTEPTKLPMAWTSTRDLHSRQLAVYGRESMRRMAASNVLIVGALGLGVEVGEPARCLSLHRSGLECAHGHQIYNDACNTECIIAIALEVSRQVCQEAPGCYR